jgi:hypothetical protein
VTGFVLHHVRIDRARQRIRRVVANEAERGQREPLDQHLHREVGHVPAAVAERVLQQRLQVDVQGIHEVELLVEIPAEHLDVAGLVDDLRRRVELRVDRRDGSDDLRRAHQRALLTVQNCENCHACDAGPAPLQCAFMLPRTAPKIMMLFRAPSGFSWSTSVDQSMRRMRPTAGGFPLRKRNKWSRPLV